jgi:hypothetical protein
MNCPYNHNDPESRFVWLEEKLETVKLERDMLEHKAWDLEKYLTKKLEELKLERDALWVKTQEDEREINQLRDAIDEKKRQRDEAIELVKDLMPFAKLDLDFDRFGVITDIQARFEDLMLEVSS